MLVKLFGWSVKLVNTKGKNLPEISWLKKEPNQLVSKLTILYL